MTSRPARSPGLKELPYCVSYFDPGTGQRHLYGRASDESGAKTLAASAKAQQRGWRDFQINGGAVLDDG